MRSGRRLRRGFGGVLRVERELLVQGRARDAEQARRRKLVAGGGGERVVDGAGFEFGHRLRERLQGTGGRRDARASSRERRLVG